MKPLYYILTALALTGTALSSAQAQVNDDVYYTPKDAEAEKQAKEAQERNNSNSSSEENGSRTSETRTTNGDTHVTNNYYNSDFNSDDYYDYQYASRLRRFYNPCIGYGYYDSYYTNSYWYDYNPYNWGVSIYLGYSWWRPSFYGSSVWGWPYYGGYYSYSYWGGFYGPSGYNAGYWNGYNHGYWNGYNHGYNDGYYSGLNDSYYYNSYDRNTHYYGPRSSTSSNGRSTPRSATFAEKFETAVASENNGRPRPGITKDVETRNPTLTRPNEPRGSVTEGRPNNTDRPVRGTVEEKPTNDRPVRGSVGSDRPVLDKEPLGRPGSDNNGGRPVISNPSNDGNNPRPIKPRENVIENPVRGNDGGVRPSRPSNNGSFDSSPGSRPAPQERPRSFENNSSPKPSFGGGNNNNNSYSAPQQPTAPSRGGRPR